MSPPPCMRSQTEIVENEEKEYNVLIHVESENLVTTHS